MEKSLLNDAKVLINNVLTLDMLKSAVSSLQNILVETYNQNEEIGINLIEETLTNEGLDGNAGDVTFSNLLQHLLQNRSQQLCPFLLQLLNHSAFQKVTILLEIIRQMEHAFLQGLNATQNSTQMEEMSIPIQSKNDQSPSQVQFRCKVKSLGTYNCFMSNVMPKPTYVLPLREQKSEEELNPNIKLKIELSRNGKSSKYFVTLQQSGGDEIEGRLQAVKKYQGLASIYSFKWNITSEDEVIANRFNFSVNDDVLVTVSYFLDTSLSNWMKRTGGSRRIMEMDTVLEQVAIFRFLFEHLKMFLRNKITTWRWNPSEFCVSEERQIWYFRIPDEVATGFMTDFNLNIEEANTRFSIGMLMLFSLSAVEEQDFGKLQKAFTAQELNLKDLHRLSPILATSKSIRSFLNIILEQSVSNDVLATTEVDWDSLFLDFQHDVDARLVETMTGFRDVSNKLLVHEVSVAVFQEMYDNFKNLEISTESLKNLLSVLFKKERLALLLPPLSEMTTFKDVLDFMILKRPWMIPDFVEQIIHNTELFSSELMSILEDTVDKHWDNQLKNLIFVGENDYGYLFQNKDAHCLFHPFGHKIVLLVPKVTGGDIGQELELIRTRPFGKIRLEQDSNSFFDDIKTQVVYSHDLTVQLDLPEEMLKTLPVNLVQILNSGLCIETWTIQYEVGRPCLRDYINRMKTCNTDPQNCADYSRKFTLEVVKAVIKDVRKSQKFKMVMPNLIPESIFFKKSYHPGNEGCYKFPPSYSDISLTSPLNPSDDFSIYNEHGDRPVTLSSNIYSLGVILIELLASNQFNSRGIGDWAYFFKGLDLPKVYTRHGKLIDAILRMVDPNEDSRMTVEELQSLEIESLNFSNKIYGLDVDERDLNTLLLVQDHNMLGAEVLKTMLDDVLNLQLETKQNLEVGKQNVLEELLVLFQQITESDEVNKSDEIITKARLSATLDGFDKGKFDYGKHVHLFQELIYEIYYNGKEDLREKLLTNVKKGWLSGFQEMSFLGNGSFGFVLKASNNASSGGGKNTAIKIIFPQTEKEERRAVEEVRHLDNIRHPNIIQMSNFVRKYPFMEAELRELLHYNEILPHSMSEIDLTSNLDSWDMLIQRLILQSRKSAAQGWLISTNLAGSTLEGWLKNSLTGRESPDIQMGQTQLRVIRDLMRGLKYLQAKGIMHSDLKPDNILFDWGEGSKYSFPVQIADLGLSRVLGGEAGNLSRRGNRRYRAPEIEEEGGHYTLNAELYSMGLIILEVLLPIPANPNAGRMMDRICNTFAQHRPDSQPQPVVGADAVVDQFIEALRKMVQKNPNERMSFTEFQYLDFDWISLHSWKPCEIQRRCASIIR